MGLGSNLGDKAGHLRKVLKLIEAEPGLRPTAVSRFYRTAPVGDTDQDWFVNAAALVETSLDPRGLLDVLLGIEERMGRVRTRKWGPRIIDLDVLFIAGRVVQSERITVPHPFMHSRCFVLTPLLDIAPDWVHPVMNLSVREMLSKIDDPDQEVRLL